MKIFKFFLLLILITKSFAFFGTGCHPCICFENASSKANIKLSRKQIKILTNNIDKKLTKTIKSVKNLLKNEIKKLKKYEKIQAIEKLSALKLKEIAFNLNKRNKLLFLQIKKEINENQNLSITEKEELLKELKNIYYK